MEFFNRQPRYMYDDRLSPMARILLNEIFSYNTSANPCKINDEYFATIFKCQPRQVRRWRNELIDKGYMYEKGKNMFAKFDIENINNDYEPLIINYKTKDGKDVCSREEMYLYFSALVAKEKLPELGVAKINYLFTAIANILFDESCYNCFISNITTSQEFFQFVLDGISVENMFTTAQRVFSSRLFPKINNIRFYVLSTLVNGFKDEYLVFKSHPALTKSWDEERKTRQLKYTEIE